MAYGKRRKTKKRSTRGRGKTKRITKIRLARGGYRM